MSKAVKLSGPKRRNLPRAPPVCQNVLITCANEGLGTKILHGLLSETKEPLRIFYTGRYRSEIFQSHHQITQHTIFKDLIERTGSSIHPSQLGPIHALQYEDFVNAVRKRHNKRFEVSSDGFFNLIINNGNLNFGDSRYEWENDKDRKQRLLENWHPTYAILGQEKSVRHVENGIFARIISRGHTKFEEEARAEKLLQDGKILNTLQRNLLARKLERHKSQKREVRDTVLRYVSCTKHIIDYIVPVTAKDGTARVVLLTPSKGHLSNIVKPGLRKQLTNQAELGKVIYEIKHEKYMSASVYQPLAHFHELADMITKMQIEALAKNTPNIAFNRCPIIAGEEDETVKRVLELAFGDEGKVTITPQWTAEDWDDGKHLAATPLFREQETNLGGNRILLPHDSRKVNSIQDIATPDNKNNNNADTIPQNPNLFKLPDGPPVVRRKVLTEFEQQRYDIKDEALRRTTPTFSTPVSKIKLRKLINVHGGETPTPQEFYDYSSNRAHIQHNQTLVTNKGEISRVSDESEESQVSNSVDEFHIPEPSISRVGIDTGDVPKGYTFISMKHSAGITNHILPRGSDNTSTASQMNKQKLHWSDVLAEEKKQHNDTRSVKMNVNANAWKTFRSDTDTDAKREASRYPRLPILETSSSGLSTEVPPPRIHHTPSIVEEKYERLMTNLHARAVVGSKNDGEMLGKHGKPLRTSLSTLHSRRGWGGRKEMDVESRSKDTHEVTDSPRVTSVYSNVL